jgi:hypothetical protein
MQVDLGDSHLNAQDGGLERDGQMLLDHDVEAGELLVLVVGVHNGLLSQGVQFSVAASSHIRSLLK